MSYERGINVTVRDLRDCLEGLPDDMDVIIPVCEESDSNNILGFRHVRTIGILENVYEPKPAFCMAASENGADMYSLIGRNLDKSTRNTKCTKLLF